MMIPSVEQVDQLSREDLIALVKKLMQLIDQQQQLIDQQQQRITSLEAEVRKLQQPPQTPKNSSLPPSQHQKPDLPSSKKRKKHGPPFGHKKYSRPLVENPDRIIQLPVTECESCLADLSQA